MNVGFIGLGRMGAGMAANLLKAGHQVTVYNRTPGKAEALFAQGARAAASIFEACQGHAVITMLANDDAVESVVLGDGGVLASLLAGAIHVSSSTICQSASKIGSELKFDEVGAPTRVESKKESARCREPFILLRLCRLDFALKAPSTMAR